MGQRIVDATHQVHAVASTSHQADIADCVQRTQFVERQALMHEVYRHKLNGAETSVDTPNELVYGCP